MVAMAPPVVRLQSRALATLEGDAKTLINCFEPDLVIVKVIGSRSGMLLFRAFLFLDYLSCWYNMATDVMCQAE